MYYDERENAFNYSDIDKKSVSVDNEYNYVDMNNKSHCTGFPIQWLLYFTLLVTDFSCFPNQS